MEKEKNYEFRGVLIGFGVLFLYFTASSFPDQIFKMIGIDIYKLNIVAKQICLIIYEIALTLIIVYIYRKDIIPNFKDFIKNNITYFKKYIKYWFWLLILMIGSNMIVTMFTTTEVAQNQQSIIDTLGVAPIYTFIVAVFTAPILEELVFRLSFRKMFKHTDLLFILFSGLFFGSMHVLGTCTNLIDLLFIIPYSIPGFIFAYCYTKSKNICVPISLHFIHNGIMMTLQILALLLV